MNIIVLTPFCEHNICLELDPVGCAESLTAWEAVWMTGLCDRPLCLANFAENDHFI